MKKEYCLDVGVTSSCVAEIIKDLEKRLQREEKTSFVAINPEKIMLAQKNEELTAFMKSATYAIPDGVGVVLAAKLKKTPIQSRITGIEMMESLLHYANEKEKRIFLYGGKETVVGKVATVLQLRFPNLLIAGYAHGYAQDDGEIIGMINESKAEFLFIALGSPKQEIWMQRYKDHLEVKVMQGVGGSFDVIAGEVKRAPLFCQKLGIEWLYRLIREPRRLKRQFMLPVFLWRAVRAKARGPHAKPFIEGDNS